MLKLNIIRRAIYFFSLKAIYFFIIFIKSYYALGDAILNIYAGLL